MADFEKWEHTHFSSYTGIDRFAKYLAIYQGKSFFERNKEPEKVGGSKEL